MNAISDIQQPQVKAKIEFDLLDDLIRLWARYDRTGGLAQFHVPGGIGLEGYKHYDTIGEYDKSDAYIARMVDAVIRDLKAMELNAIRCEYLNEPWLNKMEFYRPVLVLAREQIRNGIIRKGFEALLTPAFR